MVSFQIFGAVHDPNTFFCEHLAKKVVASVGGNDSDVEVSLSFEVDFWVRVEELKAQGHGQRLLHHREPHLVMRDKEIVGDMNEFIVLAREQYGVDDAEVSNTVIFNRHVRECSYDMMRSRNSINPIVFLRFGLQDVKRPNDFEDLGIVYIELFAKECPKAAENFRKLCEGVKATNNYQYLNCPIHRIVRNGWIQSGDVVDGSGKNSKAVLEGETVPDESFSVDFGTPFGGIIGFANEGAHSNRSQFFITIAGCPWMNNKFVGFGRILHGYSILRVLNKVETSNQVPTRIVKITDCGIPGEVLK